MQEYKKSIVIFTYIAIFSLIVPSIFWFSSLSRDRDRPLGSSEKKPLVPPTNPPEKPAQDSATANRMSIGEKLLITADQNPIKQSAIQAFAAGDYRNAITKYDASL
ncbi:MAG: hypothetical protein RLZZ69_2733, partial [Cyanobacteriota bacterium]